MIQHPIAFEQLAQDRMRERRQEAIAHQQYRQLKPKRRGASRETRFRGFLHRGLRSVRRIPQLLAWARSSREFGGREDHVPPKQVY